MVPSGSEDAAESGWTDETVVGESDGVSVAGEGEGTGDSVGTGDGVTGSGGKEDGEGG